MDRIFWLNGFILSRFVAEPHDQRVGYYYGLKRLKVSHYPAKAGGHRHCDGGDIMILVCYVTSQDHVIK